MKTPISRLLLGAAALGAGLAIRSKRHRRFSFQGRSVFITGGSRGLGLVMARLLAKEGAKLTLVGRSHQSLEVAEAELRSLGADVFTTVCDVRLREDTNRAVREAVQRFGSVDVLINNAGVIEVGPFETMTLDDFEDAMATHAWGPLNLISAALPHMKRRGGGRIINISSIGGRVAVPHLAPYTMSKFALAGLSEGLRAELSKDGILVTTVYPGLMRTGSHVNANFKGNHEAEFAWFSVMAGLPVFSIGAERAARQIVAASRRGAAELTITTQAHAAVLAKTLFPSLMSAAMSLMNAMLPAPKVSGGFQSMSGWDSTSSWSPSALTRLADRAIEKNNEYQAA